MWIVRKQVFKYCFPFGSHAIWISDSKQINSKIKKTSYSKFSVKVHLGRFLFLVYSFDVFERCIIAVFSIKFWQVHLEFFVTVWIGESNIGGGFGITFDSETEDKIIGFCTDFSRFFTVDCPISGFVPNSFPIIELMTCFHEFYKY